MKRQPDQKYVEIDEVWLQSWVAYGMKELCSYLANHAAFDQYCNDHGRG